ncbi:hypothetical protein KDH_33810 [Dictyobacter sp. S3.2.2.5]|uniref:DUF2157 domain-containing protein n=1 Tax=Dictyobacter halimunensis TaxID=3026934 RepID=A0ABQ6FU28_9CHLR|nr:hypothetical protein KDH_33810 [Dictyobacter sp. S3.2.2.5]
MRCGYPMDLAREKAFLSRAIGELARVATHGGAKITVSDLISRYERRLDYLVDFEARARGEQSAAHTTVALPHPQPVSVSTRPVEEKKLAVPAPPLQQAPSTSQSAPSPAPIAPQPTFSWHSFFADQSINIVASLGAFLILVGSLSFIATTSDLLLAFLVLLGVHIFFGATGAIAFRFPRVRTVAIIYTAIFALQIPLLGFSFYRLVSHGQLSSATLIAISAAYATLAYSSLAVYQRFKPFGYLAAVALAITDLAVASALQLNLWWWSCAFMLLAFPMLYFVTGSGTSKLSNERLEILRLPGLLLMYSAVFGTLIMGGLLDSMMVMLHRDAHNVVELGGRLSIALYSLLALTWTSLFTWRSRRYDVARLLPYLFLAFVLSLLFAGLATTMGYVLAMTLVAVFYWWITRISARRSWPIKAMNLQLEILVVLLVMLTAYNTDPGLPIQMFVRAYGMPYDSAGYSTFVVDVWLPIKLCCVVIGSAALFGVIINHVGWQKIPGRDVARWCWLLLLSGLLLHVVQIQLLLWTNSSLIWGLCVLTIAWAAVAAFIYRWVGASWSYPVAVLSLWVACESLSLCFRLPSGSVVLLLLLYIFASYTLILYMKLDNWLVLPVVLAITSLLTLVDQPLPFFGLALSMPVLAAICARWEKLHRPARAHSMLSINRAWPLYVMGLLYSVAFAFHEYAVPQHALSNWISLPALLSIEIALLALVWYVAAVIDRDVWILGVATAFAALGVSIPANQFWWLAGVAIGVLLLAVVISRVFSLKWALPWYIVAISAVLAMEIQGGMQGWSQAASWTLLGFAALIYLSGVVERNEWVQLALLWIFAALACWAVYAAGQLGDLYRPPLLTLAFAGVGLGIRYVRFGMEEATGKQRTLQVRHVLPVYATAVFGAILTGVQGTLHGVNTPFYAAIPLLLFVFALTAYGISLLERQKHGLWLVALLAFWGIMLLPSIVACSSIVVLPGIGRVGCLMQTQLVLLALVGSVLVCSVLGMIALRVLKFFSGSSLQAWGWIWYVIALVSMANTCVWCEMQGSTIPLPWLLLTLGMFTALVIIIVLVERVPELIILATVLAAWTILHASIGQWNQLGLLCLIFCLVFVSQFGWRLFAPRYSIVPADLLTSGVALIGEMLVVFCSFVLSVNNSQSSHIAAGSLVVLAGLILWWGQLQLDQSRQRLLRYVAGFLCSLAVSWELHTLGQTELTILCTTPAVYLIVIAPFIGHDVRIQQHQVLGQLCSVAGASLLLGPTLWLSFQHANVGPSLLLAGESIILLLLGFITHIRFFVLSSAALVIVTAIHVLFLPSLGIPTFLALFLLGILLVILATTLLLVRPRLATFWASAE